MRNQFRDLRILYGFFPYDGYYSETDRTGTVQKTIHLFRGTLVHAILEDLFKIKFKTFKAWETGNPFEWMEEQFVTGWKDKIEKHDCGLLDIASSSLAS